jgi:hypothetical protein
MSNDDQLILTILTRLNESQARLYVAKEAICRGYGGIQKMHELTGLSLATKSRDNSAADAESWKKQSLSAQLTAPAGRLAANGTETSARWWAQVGRGERPSHRTCT